MSRGLVRSMGSMRSWLHRRRRWRWRRARRLALTPPAQTPPLSRRRADRRSRRRPQRRRPCRSTSCSPALRSRSARAGHQRGDARRRVRGRRSPNPVVVARDRAQPELTQSLDEYVTARLSPKTLARAAEVARTDTDAASSACETTYGVPAPMMVAIWGLESNFGQFTGVRTRRSRRSRRSPTTRGGRRSSAAELFEALAIVDKRPRRSAGVQGIVGRRDGPAAVHAVELPQARRGLRRRRPDRHLDVATPTCSGRWRTTSRPRAGPRASAGAARCGSRRTVDGEDRAARADAHDRLPRASAR